MSVRSQLLKRRDDARQIWQAGVEAVRPSNCLPGALSTAVNFDPERHKRILVVGGGKAGADMVAALPGALESRGVDMARVSGWVNVPDQMARPLQPIKLHPARPLGVNEPTAAAVAGTEAMLRAVESAGPDDLLICLLSGGGSALLCAPAEGLTLADKQTATRALQSCGATIAEMNCVRKHLSRIKGGGLANRFFANGVAARRLLSLIISDVIGDPLDVIASGPTVPDPTTFSEALDVVRRYNLQPQLSAAIMSHLEAGTQGKRPETMKRPPITSEGLPATENIVIANNSRARLQAMNQAKALGYDSSDLGEIAGDTTRQAAALATHLRGLLDKVRERPLALISGGETTVVLPERHGIGGRNQQFALAVALQLAGDLEGLTVLCAGTDGEDGPTPAAGALIDDAVWGMVRQMGLDPTAALVNCNAYPLLERAGGLFITGLTGTNVMDLRVMLLDRTQARQGD